MNSKEIRALMEAYAQVYAPQQLDEVGTNLYRRKPKPTTTIFQRDSNNPNRLSPSIGRNLSTSQNGEKERKQQKEDVDIFDVVLEFLQTEGFAETLEEAEWMMANVIDEEAIDIILGEALTGERLSKAKETLKGLNPKSPKAKALKRVADSQEGSDRGDTKPGDLPSNRNQPGGNTTLPTRRGGRGRKGIGKTTNRPGFGAPLGGRTGESDRGRGNRATRRAGGEVDDTRYDD